MEKAIIHSSEEAARQGPVLHGLARVAQGQDPLHRIQTSAVWQKFDTPYCGEK